MGSVEEVAARFRSLLGGVWRRVSRRRDGRAPLWIELAVIAWLFYLYDVVNNFAPIRQRLATRNAGGLISLERSLHLNPEHALNTWLAAHGALGTVASYYYFFAHGVITFAVLGLLWWKRPDLYRRQRTLLVVINLIAFAVFWRYPLAPPRMFPRLGFVDVIATSHALVSWSSGALIHDADQLAAMPSLHIAWAIWSGLSMWMLLRRRIAALLAVAYPLMTALVVMGTGNHYLFDVLAGAATVPLAFAAQLAVNWLTARAARAAGAAIALPRAGPAGVNAAISLVVADAAGEHDGAPALGEDSRELRRRNARWPDRRGVRESA